MAEFLLRKKQEGMYASMGEGIRMNVMELSGG